jgi:thioredoxin 1
VLILKEVRRISLIAILILLTLLYVGITYGASSGSKLPSEMIKEALKNKKPFVIDFYADWCPPCRAMAPIMEELEKKYKGKVEVIRVNVDLSENRSIVIKYRVVSIPTFVFIDRGGKISNIIIGYREKEVMEDEFRKLLQKQDKSSK